MFKFEYKEIILDDNFDCYCIEGYYQTYKYFDLYDFLKMLHLDYKQNKYTAQENDVVVHIRRTDYAKNNFHKVLSINYYFNALKNLEKELNINKICFSDDLKWCKEKTSNISMLNMLNAIMKLKNLFL